MRSLFLVLLLANLVVFASQFTIVRQAIFGEDHFARAPQLNAERLRIVRNAAVVPGTSQQP